VAGRVLAPRRARARAAAGGGGGRAGRPPPPPGVGAGGGARPTPPSPPLPPAGILYHGMYGSDLAGCHVELRSLGALVSSKLPRVGRHLAATGTEMSLLATDWFLCLFCTSLPAEVGSGEKGWGWRAGEGAAISLPAPTPFFSQTAARVWDVLFVEGPKVLFRVALAVLKRGQRSLLAAPNAGGVMHAARAAAAAEHDADALLGVAFRGLGSLPMAAVDAARARWQAVVDGELAGRRARRLG